MEDKCICFLLNTPIIKSYYSYYALDAYMEHGFRIELVDASPLLNRKAYEIVKTGLMNYSVDNIHLCKKYDEIKEIINRLPSTAYVITSFGWEIQYLPIFKYLTEKKLRYGHYIPNSAYETASNANLKERTVTFLKNLSLERISNAVFRRSPRNWYHVDASSFLINNSVSEIENYKNRFYCDESTRYLVIHSNMYEEALNNIEAQRIIKERYCLWLDSYVPYHPDIISLNVRVSPKKYYGTLKNFFHWIEENYKLKVVIAAHPRSDYEKHADAYEGFTIIKFQTCLLARDAEFVMTTASTSFLYAITYMKPLLLVYNESLQEALPSHMKFMESLCKRLHKVPFKIDQFSNEDKAFLDKQLVVDRSSYYECAKKYIKKDFDGRIYGKSYKDTIVEFLNSLP